MQLYEFLSDRLKDDPDVFALALRSQRARILYYASSRLRNDRSTVLACAKADIKAAVLFMSRQLFDDHDFMTSCLLEAYTQGLNVRSQAVLVAEREYNDANNAKDTKDANNKIDK
jgi:hypothetical protein